MPAGLVCIHTAAMAAGLVGMGNMLLCCCRSMGKWCIPLLPLGCWEEACGEGIRKWESVKMMPTSASIPGESSNGDIPAEFLRLPNEFTSYMIWALFKLLPFSWVPGWVSLLTVHLGANLHSLHPCGFPGSKRCWFSKPSVLRAHLSGAGSQVRVTDVGRQGEVRFLWAPCCLQVAEVGMEFWGDCV